MAPVLKTGLCKKQQGFESSTFLQIINESKIMFLQDAQESTGSDVEVTETETAPAEEVAETPTEETAE